MRRSPTKAYPVLFRNMCASKGLLGMLDVFFPWGGLQSLTKGAVFGGAHLFMKNMLEDKVFPPTTTGAACGGAPPQAH